jgi:hypothetical protein
MRAALESTMTAMGPQHIRLQTVSQGVAMSTNTGTAADWDFTIHGSNRAAGAGVGRS